jgi:hypothetical protein
MDFFQVSDINVAMGRLAPNGGCQLAGILLENKP